MNEQQALAMLNGDRGAYWDMMSGLPVDQRVMMRAPQNDAIRPLPDGMFHRAADAVARWLTGTPEREFMFGNLADVAQTTSKGERSSYGDLALASLDMIPGVDDVLAKGTAHMMANAATAATVMGLLGHTVWHGSPHKWTKPSIDAVGTGEGAQAYGHGFYSTDTKDIAKGYKFAGQGGGLRIDGVSISGISRNKLPPDLSSEDVAALAMLRDESSLADALANLNAGVYGDRAQSARDLIESGRISERPPGHLYKLDIPDEDVAKYLDWDKPLSDQPEGVRDALHNFSSTDTNKILSRLEASGTSDGFSLLPEEGGKYYAQMDNAAGSDYFLADSREAAINWLRPRVHAYTGDDPTGAHIYRMLTNEHGGQAIGQAQASNYLRDNGIPGIRYLDGNSRNAGEGSYNYVTFDPSRINVLERNGRGLP